jgi:hypothetical protein
MNVHSYMIMGYYANIDQSTINGTVLFILKPARVSMSDSLLTFSPRFLNSTFIFNQ